MRALYPQWEVGESALTIYWWHNELTHKTEKTKIILSFKYLLLNTLCYTFTVYHHGQLFNLNSIVSHFYIKMIYFSTLLPLIYDTVSRNITGGNSEESEGLSNELSDEMIGGLIGAGTVLATLSIIGLSYFYVTSK